MTNPIIQIVVLLIVGYVVGMIPMDAMLQKLAFLVIGIAVLVVLVRWLFPGII
jgi:hypothetical protein